MLAGGVDHEDGVGQLLHVPDSTQVPLELLEFARQQQRLLLGHGLELARVTHALILEHLADALRDGREVGEGATQPTLVDERHPTLLGVGVDRILRLALGADKEHPAAVGDEVSHEDVRLLDPVERLLEIDDVDPGPLAVNEPAHLGVPAAGLVPEVHTRLEQLLHGHDSHAVPSFPIGSTRPVPAPEGDRGWVGV